MIDIKIILLRCNKCQKVYGCETDKHSIKVSIPDRTLERVKSRFIRHCKTMKGECHFVGICTNKKYGLEVGLGICDDCK